MIEFTVHVDTMTGVARLTTPAGRTVQVRSRDAFRVYQRICADYAFNGQPCRAIEYHDGSLWQIFEMEEVAS